MLAQCSYTVGTSDHAEGFSLSHLPVVNLLSSLCLSSDLALSAFKSAIDRLHSRGFFPGAAESPSSELSEEDILDFSAALTGMVCSGLREVRAPDPNSAGRAPLPQGSAA